MATRIVSFRLSIVTTKGEIGFMEIMIEDGKIAGINFTVSGKLLDQADFTAIQAAYNELKTWAQTNGYTWTAQ